MTRVILMASIMLMLAGCEAKTKTVTDQTPQSKTDAKESLDTRTQGSPIYFVFDSDNGPAGGRPAGSLSQGIKNGGDEDAVSQLANRVIAKADGSTEVTSPGQIYKMDGNTYNITVNSGGTIPTVSGGGANGQASASNTATVTPTTSQEVRPTFSLPVTVTAAPGSIAQGAPTQAVGDGGTGGAQTNTPNAEARLNRLEAQNDMLMRLVERVIPKNDEAPNKTETSE